MGLKNEGKKHLVKYVWGFAKPITVKKKIFLRFETIDESLPAPASLTRGSRHMAIYVTMPVLCLLNNTVEQPGSILTCLVPRLLLNYVSNLKRITSRVRKLTDFPILRACKYNAFGC